MKRLLLLSAVFTILLFGCRKNQPSPTPISPSANQWMINDSVFYGDTAKFYNFSATDNQLVCGEANNTSSSVNAIWLYLYTPTGIITAGTYYVVNWLPGSLPNNNECAILVMDGDASIYSLAGDSTNPTPVIVTINNSKIKATFSNATCRQATDKGYSIVKVSASISQ